MSDYRSHLSVTVWAALLALALGALLALPERVFSTEFLASPVSVSITAELLVGLVAVTVVCAGLEAAIRTHPKPDLLRHTYRYWGLPAAIVMAAGAALPATSTDAWWMIMLALSGVALAAALVAEYHTVNPDDPHFRSARLVLNGLAYTLAALAFVFIYSARSRSLISATTIGMLGGLIALDLLRGPDRSLRPVLLYSMIVAVIMAQTTWVLNYWPFSSIQVGLALLVVFYLLVGLAHQEVQGRLTRRRATEYVTLATIAMVLLYWFPL